MATIILRCNNSRKREGVDREFINNVSIMKLLDDDMLNQRWRKFRFPNLIKRWTISFQSSVYLRLTICLFYLKKIIRCIKNNSLINKRRLKKNTYVTSHLSIHCFAVSFCTMRAATPSSTSSGWSTVRNCRETPAPSPLQHHRYNNRGRKR